MKLLDLPPEVLYHFLCLVDNYKTLLNLALTCKRFQSIISTQKVIWMGLLKTECLFDEEELKTWASTTDM